MTFNPFGKGLQVSLSDLQEEVNRMFDRMWHQGISTAPLDGQEWAPPIDLVDEPTRFLLTAEVPGLSVEEIEVTYEQGAVVLRGNKSAAAGGKPQFVRRERRFGKFSRRVDLPEAIVPDGITATCRRGVLEIVLPKKEPSSASSVKINVQV